MNDYKYIKTLGQGAFAKVILCKNKESELFALKVMDKSVLKK